VTYEMRGMRWFIHGLDNGTSKFYGLGEWYGHVCSGVNEVA
jgi:hypothetical protein